LSNRAGLRGFARAELLGLRSNSKCQVGFKK
jgi:hypothetical protein